MLCAALYFAGGRLQQARDFLGAEDDRQFARSWTNVRRQTKSGRSSVTLKKNRGAAIAQLMRGVPTWFRDRLSALCSAVRLCRGSLGVLIGADLLNLE